MSFAGERLPPEWQRPLVARTHKTVSEAAVARREAAIQEWCSTHQYPAPRVIALFGPGELVDLPVQVTQRGPDKTLLDAVKRAPWRAPGLVDRLASLQIQLHALPIGDWPEPDGEGLAARRLRLVRRFLSTHENPDLSAALARVETLLPELDAGPRVACHGDFHPLNVLVDGDTSMVVDWTDAALGDRHGDVARTSLLFHFGAALATSNRAAKAAMGASQGLLSRRFLRAYTRWVPLDAGRLRKWEAVHLLHGWAQVVEANDQGGALGAARAARAADVDQAAVRVGDGVSALRGARRRRRTRSPRDPRARPTSGRHHAEAPPPRLARRGRRRRPTRRCASGS